MVSETNWCYMVCLSQLINTKLVETTTAIKNEEKKSMAKTMRGSILPQLQIPGRRLNNAHSNDIPSLSLTFDAMDFKTTAARKETTPIGQ